MLIDGIKKKNFIIVGRAGMDIFTDAGVAVEDAGRLSADLGGSAANIAVGLVKLGCQASMVTRVSDDSIGSFAMERLKAYGIGHDHVTPVGGEFRTSLAIYESRVEGHRNTIYRNGAADFQMDESDVAAVDYSQFGALITAGTVFAAEPSRSATFKSFELAKAAGLPLIFDVDYRPYSWPSPQVASEVLSKAAAQCDMIVGNDDEFGFMAGDYDKGLEKARDLAKTVEIVVYKMGEKGAITFQKGEEIRTGIYQVEALKPTGAGDSFMAGMVAGLADGQSIQDAIHQGSACAAITVSKPGCAPAMAYPDDLAAFLKSHPGPA